MGRSNRLPALGGLTVLEDRFCTFVAQGLSFSESGRKAGYSHDNNVDKLLANPAILRQIVNRIREYKRDVGAIELLSKSKQKLHALMDSADEKVVLGAAASVLRTFSGPGRKTLFEKAVEEDLKTTDLAALARSLLPKDAIMDAEIIEPKQLVASEGEKPSD